MNSSSLPLNSNSKTIVLIHGLWVTPRSWEKFQRLYEARGYKVLVPAWPGIRGDVEGMQRDPSSFNNIGIAEVVAHYTKIIQALPEKPIIIGHSYGGLITQLLVDRGLAAAGVAIDSVPPKGILVLPVSTYRSLIPALNPFHFRGTFRFTLKQFWNVFANTLTAAEVREAYDGQAIAAPGKAIFQAALSNLIPHSRATVNFKNPDRAPLLIIGGEKDVIMPAALSRKIFAKHSASPVTTDYKEFPGRSHYLIAEKGWEEVASYAIAWAEVQLAGDTCELNAA